jgi:hypothetical protein
MGIPAECAAFQKKFHVPFSMISDPDRVLYRQFNLQRMSPLGVFSPALALKSIAAMRGAIQSKPKATSCNWPVFRPGHQGASFSATDRTTRRAMQPLTQFSKLWRISDQAGCRPERPEVGRILAKFYS